MAKTFIIAEAGVNHNGDLETAIKLIDTAADAGADAVKFQTFIPRDVVSRHAKKCAYQVENTGDDSAQIDMMEKLELPFEWHKELNGYAAKRGIMFLSTPFDMESIEFLQSIDIPLFKIPSGEITNLPYLEKINSYKKDVILSTGMANIEEIKFAVSILKDCNVSLMHANTQYPTPFEYANITAMLHIKRETGLKTGYSDHTPGIEAAVAAVAIGAEIIEKHITLDKNMEGPDHRASIEPGELKDMVRMIRNVEKALGSGVKEVTVSERDNIVNVRKSIVAKKAVKKGEIFTEDNLTVKRPAVGISPLKWHEILGKAAGKDYEEDDFIE